MSTPYILPPGTRLPFVKYLHLFIPSVSQGYSEGHNLEAASDHIDYPNFPKRAFAELRYLISATRTTLPQVQVPVLLVPSKDDGNVPPESMQQIYDNLGVADKQMLWVETRGHVITRQPERMRIFQAAENFIHRIGISKNEA